jgi:translation initiation factor 4G
MMILNKLSVETFDRLSDQFLNIGMETEEIMSRVVDLIVSKAQMEEHFCFMYADLCKKISEKWVSEDVDEGATGATTPAPNGEGGSSTVDLGKAFKTRLLIRCQEEFNQDREAAIQAVLELPIAEDDKEEKLFVLKKRYTGHMRFVGEIYMKDLLKPKNVYLSIEDLLVSHDEEKLSCLCKLLQTVGKKLEAYDLKKKKGKFAEYFQTIRQMSNDKTLSTKVRFGFKDLIEMRSNNWTARRVEEKAKKLSDIRGPDGVVAGTPTNQQQQQQQYQQQGGPGSGYGAGRGAPRVSHDVRNMPPPAAAGPAAGADEWSVVPDKKGKKAVPAGKMVAPGRGVAKPTAPSGLPISSNKFSALTSSSAPSSASRSGAKSSKGRFQEGDDEISKKDPRVSIPQSSDSQAPFSPNSESPAGGDAMSPMTAAAGEDGLLDETMTASVSFSSPPLSLYLCLISLLFLSLSPSDHCHNERIFPQRSVGGSN